MSRLMRWETAVTALLIVVFASGAGFSPDFANNDNLSFALDDLSEIALIALPMTLLVVCGQVDLSVASILGLCSALTGKLWDGGMAIETIIPIVLVVGLVCGLVNGLLVTKLGLPSLAVTIGTMTLYRGLAYVTLGTGAISEFPVAYTDLATQSIPGTPIPYPIALFAVLALLTGVVLHATGLGRSLFAIGAQEDAAYFAGIRVKRIKLVLFVVSGLVAGFAASSTLPLRQRSRRQRARPGAHRHRGGAARRRRLRRRQGHPRRRHRGRAAHRPAAQPADAQRRVHRGPVHRHRAAAHHQRPHAAADRRGARGTRRRRGARPAVPAAAP